MQLSLPPMEHLVLGLILKILHNVIFASPSKSRVRNLQSIGRILRKGTNKVKATLYDISDDCTHNSKKIIPLNHLIERIKIYNEENFNYEIITIQLKKDGIEDDFYATIKFKSGKKYSLRLLLPKKKIEHCLLFIVLLL